MNVFHNGSYTALQHLLSGNTRGAYFFFLAAEKEDNEKEKMIEQIIGGICVDKAMGRHVGKMEEVFTPMGLIYNQIGKDLTRIEHVIATGGVLVRIDNPINVLDKVKGITTNLLELRPQNPSYLLDKDYILASMGLLSEFEPLLALKIMKKHLVKID